VVGTFLAGGVFLRGAAAEGFLKPRHSCLHILGSLQPLPMFERQLVLHGTDVLAEHRWRSGGDATPYVVETLA
jgi:hypothetical protein